MGHSVCLNYFKHENPQKPAQNTPRGEITVQTNMCTSHTPNILPLPVYLTHIPKLLKSCIRNSFNPKEALLQQRQTAARFFPSPTARSLPPPWLWHQKSHILSTHRWLKDIPPLRNGAGGWGNHVPDAVLSAPTGHRAHTGLCEPHLSPPQAAIEKAMTFTSASRVLRSLSH